MSEEVVYARRFNDVLFRVIKSSPYIDEERELQTDGGVIIEISKVRDDENGEKYYDSVECLLTLDEASYLAMVIAEIVKECFIEHRNLVASYFLRKAMKEMNGDDIYVR